MNRLWIGDLRLSQIQSLYTNKKVSDESINKEATTENNDKFDISIDSAVENLFLVENRADLSWFETTAITRIPLMSLTDTAVIIMLGFNDCICSCCWPGVFKIEEIAESYAEKINQLISSYNSISFYVCSVAPIKGDYAFNNKLIKRTDLDRKIQKFNKVISEKCQALFIDTYSYLNTIEYNTRDSIRLTYKSCNYLKDFILSKLVYAVINSGFKKRVNNILNSDGTLKAKKDWVLSPPRESDGDSFLFYRTDGYNGCIEVAYGSKCALPNCVGYAWGRFMEIMNTDTNGLPPGSEDNIEDVELSAGNAKAWFGNTSDGYERGDTPREGAVMCWDSLVGRGGHVAIVEHVLKDGSVITSESAWQRNPERPKYDPDLNGGGQHFYSNHRSVGDNGNWGANTSSYKFQGFIYNPTVSSTGSYTPSSASGGYVDKTQVISRNEELTKDEMHVNARYIWQYLGSKRWTLNAVAAMLGNMQNESTINPKRFEYYTSNKDSYMYLGPNPTQAEIDAYLANYKALMGRYPGYGLTQWTSTESLSSWSQHKLVSWCVKRGLDYTDIDSQLQRIVWEADNNAQWFGYDRDRADYPISLREFTTSTREPEWLAAAFLLRYEIPGDRYKLVAERQKNARYWYDYLLPFSPNMYGASLSLTNMNIKNVSPTEIQVSFVARCYEGYKYSLVSENKVKILEQTVHKQQNTADKDNNTDGQKNDTATANIDKSTLGELISIHLTDLIPNKKYSIIVKAFSNSGADEVEASIDFVTKQDYPKAITDLMLVANDNKLPSQSFKLDYIDAHDWGYWGKNSYGYVVQLFVNGQFFDECETSSIAILKDFNLSTIFSTYTSRVGDTIQIGIRTWVNDDDGNRIYDSNTTSTSNALCFLTKPIIPYLNA